MARPAFRHPRNIDPVLESSEKSSGRVLYIFNTRNQNSPKVFAKIVLRNAKKIYIFTRSTIGELKNLETGNKQWKQSSHIEKMVKNIDDGARSGVFLGGNSGDRGGRKQGKLAGIEDVRDAVHCSSGENIIAGEVNTAVFIGSGGRSDPLYKM